MSGKNSIIGKAPKGMYLSSLASPGFEYKEDAQAKVIESLEARLSAVEAKLAAISLDDVANREGLEHAIISLNPHFDMTPSELSETTEKAKEHGAKILNGSIKLSTPILLTAGHLLKNEVAYQVLLFSHREKKKLMLLKGIAA